MSIDINQYREFNPDLKFLTNDELLTHFMKYHKIEDRKYIDKFFNKDVFCRVNKLDNNDENIYIKYINDIRLQKNEIFNGYIDHLKKYYPKTNKDVIFLVNHCANLYGASHYLYNLFIILKNIHPEKNIYLCEIKYNQNISTKYGINKNNIIEYDDDPTLLYMLYEYYQPVLVYLNSINYSIAKIIKYIPENIRILHSHESYENYYVANTNPDYVVSDTISKRYKNKNIKIQPPFINNIDSILAKSLEYIGNISNIFGFLDDSKITIGMCGQISRRKNYELFIQVSKKYLQYNFIWIGDISDVFDDYQNIYHIPSTDNPYKYYKQIIDYFILFSIIDPCPYVILENILLNNNIIVFNPNILYKHKDDLLTDFYNIYPYEINFINCNSAIDRYVKQKKSPNNNNNGEVYIKQFFSYPTEIINKINNML